MQATNLQTVDMQFQCILAVHICLIIEFDINKINYDLIFTRTLHTKESDPKLKKELLENILVY